MGFFKALAATTSFGNKPKQNLEIAFNIYETFRETGELPAKQAHGGNWPGSPGFGTEPKGATGEVGTSRGKLLALKKHAGTWEGVVEWLGAEHPVGEMRSMGFNVTGKAADMKPGAFALGPKGGPFYRNLSGHLDDLTGDMWVSRTMNRLRGTPLNKDGALPDAPRNEAERKLFKSVAEGVAKKLGVKTADAQAMHWFHEKDLWGKLMGGEDFGTYATSGRRAFESLQQKRAAGGVGTASSVLPQETAKLGFEIAFGENAPLRKKYDWGSLRPEQARAVSDQHSKWLTEEIALETGAKIEALVVGTGPANWGNNPNAVVRLSGTPGQIRSATGLLGLGAQQDAIAVSRDNPQGNTPGFDVIRRGPGSRNWDRSLLKEAGDTFGKRAGGIAGHVAIEINVSTANEPMFKVYGLDAVGSQFLADAKHRERAQRILKDIVNELDPAANALARKGNYDLIFGSNDWEVHPNGEGYRRSLEAAGHSPRGLDSFHSRVSAALDAAWKRHSAPSTGSSPRAPAQEVAPPLGGGTLGALIQGRAP